MTEAVLELLRERKRQGSTPGHRRDEARMVLLVEGGSSRGAYSYGMAIAIEQLGILPLFDAVYGSSAGALNAAWLLCGRAERNMHAWWTPMIMKATIDPRRALRRRPVVDTRFLVHTVYTEIMPMGFQEILDSTVEFHPMATDALTGEATDLYEQIHDQASLQAALRASAAMPLLAGEPIEINGRSFVDAGVSEAVPVATALAQRATHIVALRTRRTDEATSAPPLGQRLVMSRWFARRAPGALLPWLRREAIRAEEERLLASHPAALQIRPPLGSAPIGHTERRPGPLRAAVDTGRQTALDMLTGCSEEPLAVG
ncbi:patatin-like phospholipase family protein [Streptomyces sp. MI02-2A]|uniref:patatin-like phospholipase family protein n=1 Tax=unclassified Streptomyces TaxID=2593676 RepID=UPI000740FA7A|nr:MULTISPECIES: patatin-like phospholipase family protein [unclassified Streptomyces]KUJ34799.1 patatin [Streptomyces sp. NRRL F-5122]MDX3265477.1 patatin-like phospholipase family protein [Streptomyces sp. MI02-2A]REE65982.1 putative patatin/cPLA2 family phospholipase [Streptomyces sp. 3212.3]